MPNFNILCITYRYWQYLHIRGPRIYRNCQIFTDEELEDIVIVNIVTDEELEHIDIVNIFTEEELAHIDMVDIFTDEELEHIDIVDIFTDQELEHIDMVDIFTDEELEHIDIDNISKSVQASFTISETAILTHLVLVVALCSGEHFI